MKEGEREREKERIYRAAARLKLFLDGELNDFPRRETNARLVSADNAGRRVGETARYENGVANSAPRTANLVCGVKEIENTSQRFADTRLLSASR